MNMKGSDEYATLLQEHRELAAEHERLEGQPVDLQEHGAHRQRLIEHNKRLHDFVVKHFSKAATPEAQPAAAGKRRRPPATAPKARKSRSRARR